MTTTGQPYHAESEHSFFADLALPAPQLQLWAYSAFTAARAPQGICEVTGMSVPLT